MDKKYSMKHAVDTVDPEILLSTLEVHRVIGLEHICFSSYPKNRQKVCRVNVASSIVDEIKFGVPQGSCLGRLLFLIYISNLPFPFKNSKVTMYADDIRPTVCPRKR